VGIIDEIRDEQTGVRVEAHAALIALLFPRQHYQIGQNLVAKYSTPPSRGVGPANRAPTFGRRLHIQRQFQFVDASKELPPLAGRQGLHVLQYFIRAHARKIPRAVYTAQVRFWQLTASYELWEEVGTSASKWVKTQGRGLANFHWQSGYGPFSVSSADVEEVVEYITQQETRHRVVSFREELRKLLDAHGIACDERYVWD
jgi:hypothetical protein